MSFRKFCLESASLPADLHITLSDITNKADHVDSIFPFFMQHARIVFPHLECIDELRHISNLTTPVNW